MDYAAAFQQSNAQLTAVLAEANPDLPVPTCPGWTLRKLLTHVGRGDRWAATIVSTRSTGPVDPATVADGKPPADHAGALDWLAAAPALLIEAAAAAPGAPVWTFIGPQVASWWVRRRLQEAVVHTADALIAAGLPVELDPALAADGVGEWLGLVTGSRAPALDMGASLHLHATDTGGEWTVFRDETGIRWTAEHTTATAALRGPAAELLLVLTRRFPLGRVERFGAEDVVTGFLARTPF
ncbi:maleylpyruvate isomerase family mycothiol-dependent enzyme [Actinokineospora guangxiensis]|uniref:Maleylpyruvate isomerase family mycothiol-dependent enzyme n=1 Tax=Actinokineospora guangxiensis TaxID=1490288 RepID=A0ABW0EKU4_9PSEU